MMIFFALKPYYTFSLSSLVQSFFFSISQLCGKGNNVTFDSSGCRVIKSKSNKTLFTSSRSGNTYTLNLNKIPSSYVCLISKKDEFWLWQGRISHIQINHLNKLVSKYLVDSLPELHFKNNKLCDAFQKVKQVRAFCKSNNIVSIDRPLQLLHMDLFCHLES